jgi:ribosomal protein S18 acetylase RimI-like enzyme
MRVKNMIKNHLVYFSLIFSCAFPSQLVNEINSIPNDFNINSIEIVTENSVKPIDDIIDHSNGLTLYIKKPVHEKEWVNIETSLHYHTKEIADQGIFGDVFYNSCQENFQSICIGYTYQHGMFLNPIDDWLNNSNLCTKKSLNELLNELESDAVDNDVKRIYIKTDTKSPYAIELMSYGFQFLNEQYDHNSDKNIAFFYKTTSNIHYINPIDSNHFDIENELVHHQENNDDQNALSFLWKCNHCKSIVGGAIVNVFDTATKPHVYIEYLCFDPQYKNCGLGKKTLKHIENYAKKIGIYDIILLSADHFTVGFYESQGYTKTMMYPKGLKLKNGNYSNFYSVTKTLPH